MIEKLITAKIVFCALDELPDAEKKLIQLAKQATTKAYAPYSNFQVGAAVLLDNGEILTGSNQENAAFSSGLCAERVVPFLCQCALSRCKSADTCRCSAKYAWILNGTDFSLWFLSSGSFGGRKPVSVKNSCPAFRGRWNCHH